MSDEETELAEALVGSAKSAPKRGPRLCGTVAAAFAIAVVLLVLVSAVLIRRNNDTRMSRNADVKKYERVDNEVLHDPETLVFVAYGQSNADCCGEPGYTVKHPTKVLQYYDGNVYQMKEPMLNAVCDGGCIWSRLGDILVDKQPSRRVVFATAAVPGVAIRYLLPNTAVGQEFEAMLKALPTATVLFQQGETDAALQTDPDDYAAMLHDIVRVAAAVATEGGETRVGVGTRHGTNLVPYEPVAAVQRQYANGPDLDTLGTEFRWQGSFPHFNRRGLQEAAQRWALQIDVVNK